MGKRLCSVLLSFCLVVGLMPCLAYAEVPHEGSASGSSAAQGDATGLAEATTTEAATSPENTTGGILLPRAENVVYVSAVGDDTSGDGTVDNPYATLAKAVDAAAPGTQENPTVVCVMSDLKMTKSARFYNKHLLIMSDESGPHTLTRGDEFETLQDSARSTYNPAMIEVDSTVGRDTASLVLKNIVLDDVGKHAGDYFIQADSEGDGKTAFGDMTIKNDDIVQDAMIATYNGVGTITLDDGAVLKNYGGMSAVRLSDGKLVMKAGSKIIDDDGMGDRVKGADISGADGGYYGPAGAVWLQGGTITMETDSLIGGADANNPMVGRAIYNEGGTATINGTIYGVKSDSGVMWQGSSGAVMHMRSEAVATLGATGVVDGAGIALKGSAIGVLGGCKLTTESGSVVKGYNDGNAFDIGGTAYLNGEITGLTGGGHAILAQSSSNHYIRIGETASIYDNVCSYGVIYTQGENGVIDIYGKINDNVSKDRGGALVLANNGSHVEVNMYEGAEMCGNVSWQTGGAVMVSCGTFTMYGGTISGNLSGAGGVDEEDQVGGGVYVRRGGQFVMKGGTIEGNKAGSVGGSVAVSMEDYNRSTPYVELQGGSVSGGMMDVDITKGEGDAGPYTTSGGTSNDIAITAGDYGKTDRYLCVSEDFSLGDQDILLEEYGLKLNDFPRNVKVGNASESAEDAINQKMEQYKLTKVFGSFWFESDRSVQSFVVGGLRFDKDKPLFAAMVATDEDGEPAASAEVLLQAVTPNGDGTVRVVLDNPNETGYVVMFVQESDESSGIVTVTPADMTVYMGGDDGYEAVVGEGGESVSSDSLPRPLFKVSAPSSVSDVTELTFANSESGNAWKLVPVEPSGESTSGETYYRFDPVKETMAPVRVEYSDGVQSVSEDSFSIDEVGELYKEFSIGIYAGDTSGNVEATIPIDTGTGMDTNSKYSVVTGSGLLTVRAVSNAEDESSISEVRDEAPFAHDAAKAVAVAPSDTVYTLNDTGVTLSDDAVPSLLFDGIITSDGVDRIAALENAADYGLGAVGSDRVRRYDFKYLDLVDANNGNVWITSSKGVDVYWAYPEGTDGSTDFKLLHFEGLHRDGTASGFDLEDVAAAEVEQVAFEKTDYGIKFHVDAGGFSPFALVWDEPAPVDPDPDDPTPPVDEKVTISYEENGGNEVSDQTVTKGTTVTLPTPLREGWTFEGWYADAGLTELVGMGGDEIELTADRTVWAKWSRTGVPGSLTEDHVNYVMGRTAEDGTRYIAPLADVTRAEVATMVFRLLEEDVRAAYLTDESPFPDVDSDAWYAEPVATLASMGAILGYPDDGTFRPDQPITRAELTAIVTRLDEHFADDGTLYGEVPFSDVPETHWAYPVLSYATNRGWLMGDSVSDGTFRPDDTITRAETMAIFNRVLQRLPYSAEDILPGRVEWPDNQDESAWYWLVVEEATNNHDHAWVSGEHGVHEPELGADGQPVEIGEHEKWTVLLPNVEW